MRNLCIVLLVAMCMSCNRHAGMHRHSNGRPFSAVVISDDTVAAGIIKGILETSVAGLPQQEPSFDVTVARELNDETSTMRNIVVVKTDSTQFASTQIKYEDHAYAEPQLLILVTSPSAERLRTDMETDGARLLELLENAEMNNATQQLRKDFNKEQTTAISQMLGVNIQVPKELTHSKRGKDFIWLSNNAASGMQNICIYTFKDRIADGETFIRKRDSIMHANIPGEREGMWMTTARGSETVFRKAQDKDTMLIVRGRWEMKGDMMGGPFVAHAINDMTNGRTIVAEAFVYAPESDKRNKIRQLEAALYTLFINKEKDDGK